MTGLRGCWLTTPIPFLLLSESLFTSLDQTRKQQKYFHPGCRLKNSISKPCFQRVPPSVFSLTFPHRFAHLSPLFRASSTRTPSPQPSKHCKARPRDVHCAARTVCCPFPQPYVEGTLRLNSKDPSRSMVNFHFWVYVCVWHTRSSGGNFSRGR